MIRLENVLKISLQDVLKTFFKMSWRRFEDIFKAAWRCLEHALKTFVQDVWKSSWKHLEDVLARRLEDVLARRLEDVLKTSWKRLENVFWRCRARANIFVLIKTSSSRRMFAGYCLHNASPCVTFFIAIILIWLLPLVSSILNLCVIPNVR